ncbi:hypothetical protein K7X08_010177 [Anisodus acutangulus]|uniref:Coenzyme Q-binding protein COQ10 START domain-containing protein n=1 Tax=Anisodus acutangulus TaxID=402998 RepID=A0A9Q1RUV7_9SOLA|nr:hypothetical protein K7X08_010177 [Anisodus acutangulus]
MLFYGCGVLCWVKREVDVPISVAYKCYSDREAIPEWMPFISSVKILEDKPDLSRWSLKYKAFGQNIEYSWLARNMQFFILFYSLPQTRRSTGDLWTAFLTGELCDFPPKVHHPALQFHMKCLSCWFQWHQH